MKLRCPRCEKKLSIPDKYGGKAIRCPSCNRGFKVPKPQVAAAGGASELDLEGLARLEAGTSEMSEEEREQVETDLAAAETAAADGMRICPNCRNATKEEDPTVDLLCSHCWKPIPATAGGGLTKKRKQQKEVSATAKGGFYAELASSVVYPTGALSSIMTAASIAFGAALIPVVILTGASQLMEQSNVGTEQGVQEADLSVIPVILTSIFGAEVFFFSAVAIHAFFDVVRSTGVVGEDAAPKLSFVPSHWGKSFASYAILCVYYLVMTYVVALVTLDESTRNELLSGNITSGLGENAVQFAVGMILVSFMVPMNLLGIALGNIGQALSPANVFKSIGRTHVHYVFLVLILSVYGGLFGYAFLAILFDWFIPKVNQMISSSEEGAIADVSMPLGAWGLVMAFFFYGTYILARLHGLFVRSFRKSLLFGTD